MSITRKHPAYHRQQIGYWLAVAGVPFAVAAPAVIYSAITGNTRIGFGGLAAGFLATQAASQLWDHLARRTNCPQCGMTLRRMTRPGDGSYGYNCEKCDVVWDTGIPARPDRLR